MSADVVNMVDTAPAVDPTPVPEAKVEQLSETTTRVSLSSPEAAPEVQPEVKLGEAPKVPEAPAPVDLSKATPEEAAKAVTDAGLEMSKLAEEYNTSGQLSEETYSKLESKGITKATVDAYIEGQKAIGEKYTNELAEAVGGKETLSDLLQWAGENLTDGEKAAANKALQSMDAAQAKLVLGGLQARYKAAVGSEPSLVNAPSAPPQRGPQPFRSNAEIVRAMQDPKYRSDPAYRAEVAARLAAS